MFGRLWCILIPTVLEKRNKSWLFSFIYFSSSFAFNQILFAKTIPTWKNYYWLWLRENQQTQKQWQTQANKIIAHLTLWVLRLPHDANNNINNDRSEKKERENEKMFGFQTKTQNLIKNTRTLSTYYVYMHTKTTTK